MSHEGNDKLVDNLRDEIEQIKYDLFVDLKYLSPSEKIEKFRALKEKQMEASMGNN